MNTTRLAAFVATILGVDALAHLYWLIAPASDPRALSMAVLNMDVPFTPRILLPLILLLTAAATAIVAVSRGRGGWPAKSVVLALFAGLLVRGLLGLVWAFGLGTGTLFYWLNLVLYTPVCLMTAGAVGLILARTQKAGARV
ncbi:DUF3995 domain-containing protein [Nonomuraea endophytica]|uniref:DUF3995 domain-containing protein n=1 Tax=Nonomuraea endophytica TaxID=714136 RepID=A0A7W8A6B7_9ACTN|nr:DUF3995 domain-containing protein [Nonomuraea endophytica]MBB5079476.1 hypothetical protein [Nonomuraea endophytica]